MRFVEHDPVKFLHPFDSQEDKELAGFIAAQFAYGQIGVFEKFLEALFAAMGNSPMGFVLQGEYSALQDLYYRFHKGEDLIHLFGVLNGILRRYGSMGAMFRQLYSGDTRAMIWKLREELPKKDDRLTFFFPKPSSASPMKRWNLYLRWMVRRDDIDVGVWDFIPKARLVVPLDTHIFKIARCFGWTKRRNPSWQTACEITDALRAFSPEDPLRYDFFLCHQVGRYGGCTGRRTSRCARECLLTQGG